MTVAEIIAKLQKLPQDADVVLGVSCVDEDGKVQHGLGIPERIETMAHGDFDVRVAIWGQLVELGAP